MEKNTRSARRYHTPVLLPQTLEALNIAPGKRYIDATLGGGGHAVEIVRRGGKLLGIDTDRDAVTFARTYFQSQVPTMREGDDWKIVQGNFGNIAHIATREGFGTVNGILLDLGVSSHQLDSDSRGFSYRFPSAPLDLRLSQDTQKVTAADVVRGSSEKELYEILATYGEEKFARAIAHALILARRVAPIQTVGQLVEIVSGVSPHPRDTPGTLSRVFQALRIATNDELAALKSALGGAWEILVPGGRLVVISFHSLEDRIVKQTMRGALWHMITKKPITAEESEIETNVRSRSAKLRIAEKREV